jgi:hypothetical protein
MKNVIMFFVKYVTVLIVGIFVGIVCVYLFFMSTSLVAGGGVVFPYISIVVPYLPTIGACAAIISCFCLITRIARQRDLSFFSILVCGVLHICTWFVFLPVGDKVTANIIEKMQSQQTWQPSLISPGYFRIITDGGLFYYFRVNDDKTGDGIFIDLNPDSETLLQFLPLTNTLIDAEALGGDVLIRRTVALPAALSLLLHLIVEFHNNALQARALGILVWYAFASVCYPLVALVAFAHASKWRLINFALLSFTFGVILLLNVAYFEYAIPTKLSVFTGFFRVAPVLNRLPPEAESYILLVVFNVLAASIIAFLGFCAYIKKKRSTPPPPPWTGDD